MTDQISPYLPPIFDKSGNILSTGFVYFYKTGTTVLVDLKNAEGGNLLNPVELSNGVAPQVFYEGADPLRAFIVRNLNDSVPVYDIDPCPRFSQAGTAAADITRVPSAENDKTTVEEAIQFNAERIVGLIGNSFSELDGASTADAVVLTSGREYETLVPGIEQVYLPIVTNTGAMTLVTDGGPAVPVKTITGVDTPANYVRVGQQTRLFYDGTNWIMDRLPEITTSGTETVRRYADGTQIIDGIATSPATGSGTGGGLPGATGDTYTFSAAFVDTSFKLSPQTMVPELSPRIVGAGNRTTTSIDIQNYDETGSPSGNSVSFTAIGNWY